MCEMQSLEVPDSVEELAQEDDEFIYRMYPRILAPKIIYCTKPDISAASVTAFTMYTYSYSLTMMNSLSKYDEFSCNTEMSDSKF